MGRYEELDSIKSIEELIFLKEWFLEHIGVFDMQYSAFKNIMHESSEWSREPFLTDRSYSNGESSQAPILGTFVPDSQKWITIKPTLWC